MLNKMYIFRSLLTINRLPSLSHGISTKSSLIDLAVDREGIALMSWKRPPVNSLNIDLLQAINANLDIVRENKCKGLVITSALPTLFSAGIDLNEVTNPDPKRLRLLWWSLQEMCLKLYGSEYTTSVAINGFAAAGACAISLFCDYRVMVKGGKARIGMNDTAVGIVPRPWVCEIFNRVMGCRQAEIALIASTMHTAEEALKVNLIDETAVDKEEAIKKCKLFLRKCDHVPFAVRAATKRNLRESVLKYIEENREHDIDLFVQEVMDEYTQKQVSMYLEQLQKK